MHNLLLAIVSFLLFLPIVFLAARFGKASLFALSVAFIVMSNITVQMQVELFSGVVISWAIIIYSLVYLITDLVIEFYGRKVAYGLAGFNLAVQMVLWLYVGLSLKVTPAQFGSSVAVHETMRSLFGTTSQITIAAVVAAIGPFSDIYATTRIREYLKRRRFFENEVTNLLARTKLSTFIGEVVNTVLFFGLALIGTGTPLSALVQIVVTATIAKWIISLADAPFLWVFLRFFRAPSDADSTNLNSGPSMNIGSEERF